MWRKTSVGLVADKEPADPDIKTLLCTNIPLSLRALPERPADPAPATVAWRPGHRGSEFSLAAPTGKKLRPSATLLHGIAFIANLAGNGHTQHLFLWAITWILPSTLGKSSASQGLSPQRHWVVCMRIRGSLAFVCVCPADVMARL